MIGNQEAYVIVIKLLVRRVLHRNMENMNKNKQEIFTVQSEVQFFFSQYILGQKQQKKPQEKQTVMLIHDLKRYLFKKVSLF